MGFNKNPFIGSLDVPDRRADGWIGMRNLIVAVRNFVNAPERQ
jgi:hypothetical protein